MGFKKFVCTLLCLLLLCSLTMPVFAAQGQTITVDPINVMVGGKVFLPTDVNGKDVPIFVYSGTTYAPLRALAEAYGLTVGYNAEKKLATVDGTPSADFVGTKGTAQALTKRTTLSVSPINIEVNGAVFQPKDVNGNAVSVFVYNGTTYAPLRALAEAYGLTVGYDQQKRLATVDFRPSTNMLATLMTEVNAARKAELMSPTVFYGYSDYLVSDPSTKGLISPNELDLLMTTSNAPVSTVTYAQAVSDIDLLFRALHVCYGAYYYFGQQAYDQAEQEVLTWLQGQNTVSVSELVNVLRKSLSFMVDAHSFVGYSVDELDGIRYEYHYCTGQVYSKDNRGYFKTLGGRRLDFVSFSDARVSMEPTLLESGEIVYSPVLFCPETQLTTTTITLKDSGGQSYTETIDWQPTPAYGFSNQPDYHFLKENGLAYLSIRSFDEMDYPDLYAEFSQSGAEVKDCKALIFDLRGNVGGGETSIYNWAKNFAGEYPVLREAQANRYSIFNSNQEQSIFEVSHIDAGKWLPNDIPIIVLVNDCCASAGETALNTLKTMDNVLVVGSNSSGYQLGGNAVQFTLPNTKIWSNIGTQLRFFFDMENVDCIGYPPDLWCPPHTALESVLNMLVKYGLTHTEDAAALQKRIDEDAGITPDSITLRMKNADHHIGGREIFYVDPGTHDLDVYLNGAPTADFTVRSSGPVFCTAEKSPDGRIKITADGYGCAAITVKCGKAEQMFLLICEGNEYSGSPGADPAITLDWLDVASNIRPDGVFGNSTNFEIVLHVLVDGVRTTDFTVISSDPDGCTAYRSADGYLMLNATASGYYGITVRWGDVERTFLYWGHA